MSSLGYTSVTTTGRRTIQVNNNPGTVDNVAAIQLSGGTWTGTATIQGNPFTTTQDPDGNGWQNISAQRQDTLAIEATPTLTSNTARTWLVNCAPFQQICLNITAITGTLPMNIYSYFNEMGINLVAPASISGNQAISGTVTVTSSSTAAMTVGANGATNPVLTVDAGTASVATGVEITGAAAAGGVAVVATSSGTNESMTIDAKGSGTITLNGTATGNVLTPRAVLSSSATGGIGYTTGAGGTVTQATNKSTGVTLNTVSGQITMNNASLNDATTVSFTVTNSAVAANDNVIVAHSSAGTAGAYLVSANAIGAGSYKISVRNVSGGALGEAIVIQQTVIKGVAA